MNMEHLKYLLEIDKYRSISVAAQKLYLGQSTLSTILKNVEEELGFDLFHRTHAGMEATAEGEEALALIRELDTRYEEIRQLKNWLTADYPVSIVLSPSIASGLTLPLNQLFLEQEPGGNLEFQVELGDDIGPQIIKNNGSIGLTYFNSETLEAFRFVADRYQIKVDVMMKDQLYLLLRKDHPLATRKSVFLPEIKSCNHAMLAHFVEDDSSNAYVKHLGCNNYTVFPSVPMIKQAILEENMVAILSGYACRYGFGEKTSRLKTIRLEGMKRENNIMLCLIYRNDSSIRYLEKTVIQCVRDYFNSLET